MEVSVRTGRRGGWSRHPSPRYRIRVLGLLGLARLGTCATKGTRASRLVDWPKLPTHEYQYRYQLAKSPSVEECAVRCK
jgi:hypothetical protein